MWLGVDYYPEQWPESRWPVDAKLMKEAGLGVVRLAEFAWSRIEPDEQKFDFAWLDRAIAVLHDHDIKVVLGTPTAAPPAWLIQKHPDILPVDAALTVKSFGVRRHYCFNNEQYHHYSKTIAAAMGSHYCTNPAVIGWQIDNELGGHDTVHCYCENCAREFRRWLKAQHGTLADLNAAWGTVVWSQEYSHWDQVPLPWKSVEGTMAHNPSMLLDYFRFASDSVVAYQKMQIDVIRDLCPRHFITANLMGLFDQIDYFELAADLDFVSWDNFPNYCDSSPHWAGLSHDVMRGLRGCDFWVMEQQSGAIGWNILGRTPRPGMIRLWTYQAIGHGAESILYYHWRTAPAGTEQFCQGILDHHGNPGRRYREIAQVSEEIRKSSVQWSTSCPRNQVAFVLSYPIAWALRIQPQNAALSYWHEIYRLYEALRKLGVGVEFVGTGCDLAHFKLVLAPLLFIVDRTLAENLKTYVTNGGTLVGTFRSGVKDEHNLVTTLPLPGLLADIFGIRIDECDSMDPGSPNSLRIPRASTEMRSQTWADIIEPQAAQVLATYAGDYYAGKPAITVNALGKGKAYYIGTSLDAESCTEFLRGIVSDTGVCRLAGVPEGVDAAIRCHDGQQVIFLVNPFKNPAQMELDGKYQSVLEGKTVSGRITIPEYGVMILREEGGTRA